MPRTFRTGLVGVLTSAFRSVAAIETAHPAMAS